jgi:DNA-binding XRE family transcriptional regulator
MIVKGKQVVEHASITRESAVLWDGVERLPHLRAWREYQSFGQRELAVLAGLNQATLYNIEVLERPAQPKTVRALAKALGITVQQIRRQPPTTEGES